MEQSSESNKNFYAIIIAVLIIGGVIYLGSLSQSPFNLSLNWDFVLSVLVGIATVSMAIFAYFTWRISDWQQKQVRDPTPEIYFAEPQVLAISKDTKKILITFLVYFLNTGLSPIIGSGLEHRINNLETGEKYKFGGDTRFFGDQDKSFGVIIPELHKLLPKIKKIQTTPQFHRVFKIIFDALASKRNIEIFDPYPSQKIEELWSLEWEVPSKDYISEKVEEQYWVLTPHKSKIKRYYVKVPYKDDKYYSFNIKLILHYYCGSKPHELLKCKEFNIKPVTVGKALCFYESEMKTRAVFHD